MRYFFLLCFLLHFGLLSAQEAESEEVTPFNNSTITYSGGLTTRGWYGDLRYAFGKNSNKWLVSLEVNGIKGNNENRIRTLYMDWQEGSRYVYGKVNRLTAITMTTGLFRTVFPLNDYNKVKLNAAIGIGPTFGLIRPYYLNVAIFDSLGNNGIVKEIPANSVQYDYSDVVGEVPFYKNVNITQLYPGISLRAVAQVDFNRSSNSIKGLQLSLNGDWFSKKITLMQGSATRGFLYAGIGIVFGKRM